MPESLFIIHDHVLAGHEQRQEPRHEEQCAEQARQREVLVEEHREGEPRANCTAIDTSTKTAVCQIAGAKVALENTSTKFCRPTRGALPETKDATV